MRAFTATEPVRFIGGNWNGRLMHPCDLIEEDISVVNKLYSGKTITFPKSGRSYAFCISKNLPYLTDCLILSLGIILVKKLHEGMNYMDVFSLRKGV